MRTVQALLSTLRKMFAADLGLTVGAMASVGLTAALARTGALPASAAPFLLAALVLAALAIGVFRRR